MQAVVLIGKSQYLISEGDILEVDSGQGVTKILMIIDGDNVVVGDPEVKGASVKTKVLGETKGDKLRVATFKAKTRHRRVIGFRAKYTKLSIERIKFSHRS
ncbi:50S ribosomal protein L21 [Candidatus Amesbacteria bacterium]|nr:50S ribosomal protein L21 [Candidatus Amesbacteria bacterium]